MPADPLDPIIQELLSSRKYKGIDLPAETVRDLLVKELPNHRSPKAAVQEVRKKLHNIVAPYLGDPDYPMAAQTLEDAFRAGGCQAVKAVCSKLLLSHASTRERLKILDEFYPRLFSLTGTPHTILDLACGLNPLTFPWMGLPVDACYYAYDIHRPRVAFINRFFELEGLAPLAVAQDVLVDPPQVEGNVAFLFKEAHRFEQRQRGCNRALWLALKVRYLLVSLPPHSLSGQHNLVERQRRLVYTTLEGLPWEVSEIMFENELVFIIKK
jgi:16S rRNA (guanine(1405)-N(7))-methyltransferase